MTLGTTIVKKDDNTYLVKLNGSLDTETSPQFQEELKGIIDDQIKGINLDMSELRYISSAGIGIIMWASKVLKGKNAAFTMTDLQPQIHDVFESMKILPTVNIFKHMEEADRYIDHIIQHGLEKQQNISE